MTDYGPAAHRATAGRADGSAGRHVRFMPGAARVLRRIVARMEARSPIPASRVTISGHKRV